MKAAMIGRGLLWLLAVVVLGILAILTASGRLAVLILVLILLPLLSLLWNRQAGKHMSVQIRMPASARKLSKAEGSVTASFRRLPPLGSAYCIMELHNDLTGEKTVLPLPLERGREGYTADYSLYTAHCGRIRGVTERVILTDFLGFLPSRIPTHAEGRAAVLPETFPVEMDPALLTAPKDGDDTRDDQKGSDMTETFQLREYQPGDNLHGIHWKLSSKLDKLIFREPAQPVSNALLLYWDQSAGTPDQLDALAEAVFSVGQRLCEMGVPFTVAWNELGVLREAEITNQDTLIDRFPVLLRRRGAERTDVSALAAFGRVFYFTADMPQKEPDGAVQVFLCGEENSRDGSAITFTPDNVGEVLERLTAYGA